MDSGNPHPPPPWAVRRPMVLAAVAMIGGHGLGGAWPAAAPHWPHAAALAALALFFIFRHRSGPALAFFLLGFLCLAQGNEWHRRNVMDATRRAFHPLEERAAQFSTAHGRVQVSPRRTNTGWVLWLRSGNEVASGDLAIRNDTPLPIRIRDENGALGPRLRRVAAGDQVELVGRTMLLSRPGEDAVPDQLFLGRGAVLSMRAGVLHHQDQPRTPWNRLRQFSRGIGDNVEDHIAAALPPSDAALLNGLLLGRVGDLPREHQEAYARTGLIHLFSVSGFHTMLVGAMTLGFLLRLGLSPLPRVLLFLPCLLAFAMLTGLSAPVLRASLLLVAAVTISLTRVPVDSLSTLATMMVGMMVLEPGIIHALDFQLTFLCSAVIILCGPWVLLLAERLGPRLGWRWHGQLVIYALQVALVSAMIQIAATPLLASAFGQVSIIAPFANVLLLWPFTMVLLVAFVIMVLSLPFDGLAQPLFGLLARPLDFLQVTTEWIGAPGMAIIHTGHWPAWSCIPWFAILFLGGWVHRSAPSLDEEKTPILSAFWRPLLSLALLLAWLPLSQRQEAELCAWFLDIGQGDATLLRTRDGRFGLVDAGPDGSIIPWLQRLNVESLDWIVATHADADHIGGLAEVLRQFPCDRVIVGGSISQSQVFRDAEHEVFLRDILVTTVRRGATIQWGSPPLHASVLHPTESFVRDDAARNDASVVLLFETPSGSRLLLAGDAEGAAERDLIGAGLDLRAAVLKIGHHGSRSSTSAGFLRAVRPTIAVISCGRGNRFGHPHSEVISRLGQENTQQWRTDLHGTIALEFLPGGQMRLRGTRGDAAPQPMVLTGRR